MSIVNKRLKTVFIHVPKTGGMSISSIVGGQSHLPAKKLVKQHPNLFSFGFVRNPYDRLVSVYYSACQHGTRWPHVEACRDFEEFIEELWQCRKKHKTSSYRRRMEPRVEHGGDWLIKPHAMPMVHFLCDENGKVLVDFVGRFETLYRGWRKVRRKLNIKKSLPHQNRSKHKHWKREYNVRMIEIVNEVYAEDFKVFGYERIEV